MDTPELVALAIFVSYLLLNASLFIFIIGSLWPKIAVSAASKRVEVRLFSVLTLVSLAHTWYYMFAFLLWSFRDFESKHYASVSSIDLDGLTRLSAWLVNSDLFEQAWGLVCGGTMNWWWSEKLCLFTVGYWTVFLATEGRFRGVSHIWAYMVLGQLVAISVAANLFYVALLVSTPPKPRDTRKLSFGPLLLWLSVIPTLLTVFCVPYTGEKTFPIALFAMHAFIIVPSIYLPGDPALWDRKPILTIVSALSFAFHVRTTVRSWIALPVDMQTVTGFATAAWDTVYSHPAQTSISWDVIWTFVSVALWYYLSPEHVAQGVTEIADTKPEVHRA